MSARERKIFWPVILLLACTLSVLTLVSARSKIKAPELSSPILPRAAISPAPLPSPTISPLPSPSVSPLPVGSSNSNSGPVRVARFTVYDAGIYPAEVHVKKGSIRVLIEDLSGGTLGVALTATVNLSTSGGGTGTSRVAQRDAASGRGRMDIS